MSWSYAFDDPLPDGDERRLVGGKAYSLRLMTAAGLPVPPGFTLTTEAGRAFLAGGGRRPGGLDEELRRQMARLEERTGRRFGRDLLVSVRSGAAVSMPGMMDTKLNVGRAPDPWAELLGAIDAVFASWNSERARVYRGRHGLADGDGTSATVQAMFPSEIAGVVFTLDVDRPESDRMIVEAAAGLGERVVSGDVTPERLAVARGAPRRVERLGGEPSGLTDAQATALAELSLRVEALFGGPCDIEWGWAGGALSLLQARPVRGLDVARAVAPALRAEVERLRAVAGAGPRRLWVAHNLSETLRAPTPLTWEIVRRFMSGDGGYGRLFRMLGYRPSRRVSAEGFLELIGGRIYADPDRLAELFWDGMPLAYDPAALAADPRRIDGPPDRFEASRADGRFLTALPATLLGMWRAARAVRRLRAGAAERFAREALPFYLRRVQEERRIDLAALDPAELRARLRERRRFVLDEFAAESLLPGFLGSLAFESLREGLRQILGPVEGETTAQTLVQGLEGDTTVEQEELLEKVARGEATLQAFLERFGHRCAGEMELAEPRWRDDPTPLERALARLRASGTQRRARQVEQRRAAEAALPEALARAGASSLREPIERDLRDAQRLLPYRESGKHYLMMGYALLRDAIEEIGRRRGLGGLVYFLTPDELENGAREAAEERRVRWQALQRLDLPDVVDSTRLEELGTPRPAPEGRSLEAVPIAPGVADGPARIVRDPGRVGEFRDGDVLVCPSTDPGWTTLCAGASALVVERGGVLSHGAIIARDFGIPAVCCAGATRLLAEGERVRIDGNTGRIVRLGAP